ncbi:MAG: hypothetical protein M5U28_25525 [Sandaracinaceae bacterium]|nr:hypothetical protein [Sandaracinaceae bacterium]
MTPAGCAAHEGAQATGVCARCGSFVCPLCLDPRAASPERCAACRAREGAERMAWERDGGGAWRRFLQTCADVLLRPTETFERARPGSARRALAFAVLAGAVLGAIEGVLGCAITLVVVALGLAPEAGAGELALTLIALVILPLPLSASLHALSSLAWAAVHAGVTAALGGRARFATSLWAVSYLQAANLLFAPLTLVLLLPYGELVALGATVALAAWASVRLTHVTRRFWDLSAPRAAIAGSLPPLTLALAVLALALFP